LDRPGESGAVQRFELTSARGRPFGDPDVEIVRKILVHLSADNYYAILTRADGWYIQVGYGERVGARPGWEALEQQDGTPEQHFGADLTDIEEVVHAFTGFLDNDPTVAVPIPLAAARRVSVTTPCGLTRQLVTRAVQISVR
jgi:hypothetical protein